MKETTEQKINEIACKIDTIHSIFRALMSSFCETEELTKEDAFNFLYLLEEKLKILKSMQNELIKELGI